MDTFRVNQEPDSLLEYHEEVVSHIQAIEDFALSLENHPDDFHSMISQRPHARNVQRSLLDVVAYISNNSGSQFDSHMVKIFIKCLKDYWAPRHVIKEYESRVVLDFEV